MITARLQSSLALTVGFLLSALTLQAITVTQHPDNSYLVFEAEIGDQQNTNPTNLWLILNDTNAYSGLSIQAVGEGTTAQDGKMVYTLAFTNLGTYKIYFRSRIFDDPAVAGDANSFFLGNNFNSFATLGSGENIVTGSGNLYAWKTNSNKTNYNANTFSELTLTISPRESGAILDTFVFSTDFNLTAGQLDAIVTRGNIPEPGTASLMAVAALLLLARRCKMGLSSSTSPKVP